MATAADLLGQSRPHLNGIQQRYLRPLNLPQRCARRTLFAVNRASVRAVLRLKVEGLEHLPPAAPYILAPSHTSSLDPFVLACALPYRIVKQAHWAAAARAVLVNPFRRASNRLAGAVPIWRGRSALAVGTSVLQRDRVLIWFPEGHRTRTGELQELRPGIGLLAVHTQVPVVPIRILGGYQAMPPGTKIPKWRSQVVIRLGPPLKVEGAAADADETADQFTDRLFQALQQLGQDECQAIR